MNVNHVCIILYDIRILKLVLKETEAVIANLLIFLSTGYKLYSVNASWINELDSTGAMISILVIKGLTKGMAMGLDGSGWALDGSGWRR